MPAETGCTTLVEKPPEGDGWIHEVKFDGYRSQIIKDGDGVRIFTRRGLDWTSEYRDLAKAAGELDVGDAVIDGEVIVTNEAGLSDFRALRKAITSRPSILSPSICCISTVMIFATCRWRTDARSCKQ